MRVFRSDRSTSFEHHIMADQSQIRSWLLLRRINLGTLKSPVVCADGRLMEHQHSVRVHHGYEDRIYGGHRNMIAIATDARRAPLPPPRLEGTMC
jgi:hypothetical protein